MTTSVDFRSFCSEVTEEWLGNQEPIGGPEVVVEIDETLLVRRKYERGRLLKQVWCFGGIERASKKLFVVPLVEPEGEDRSAAVLVPLIQRFIRPGSIVISDGWRGYRGLSDLGYVHKVINHSENFVDPQDPEVHTQTVERLWRDVKEWVKRPGMRTKYLKQYFARYLFLHQFQDNAFHNFLAQVSLLYPPQTDRIIRPRVSVPPEEEEFSECEEARNPATPQFSDAPHDDRALPSTSKE